MLVFGVYISAWNVEPINPGFTILVNLGCWDNGFGHLNTITRTLKLFP